jgi:hypothetical protein
MIAWRTSNLLLLFLLIMIGTVGITASVRFGVFQLPGISELFTNFLNSEDSTQKQANPSPNDIDQPILGATTIIVPVTKAFPTLKITANQPSVFDPTVPAAETSPRKDNIPSITNVKQIDVSGRTKLRITGQEFTFIGNKITVFNDSYRQIYSERSIDGNNIEVILPKHIPAKGLSVTVTNGKGLTSAIVKI